MSYVRDEKEKIIGYRGEVGKNGWPQVGDFKVAIGVKRIDVF